MIRRKFAKVMHVDHEPFNSEFITEVHVVGYHEFKTPVDGDSKYEFEEVCTYHKDTRQVRLYPPSKIDDNVKYQVFLDWCRISNELIEETQEA